MGIVLCERDLARVIVGQRFDRRVDTERGEGLKEASVELCDGQTDKIEPVG